VAPFAGEPRETVGGVPLTPLPVWKAKSLLMDSTPLEFAE
jgi:hypothetical protein